MIGEPTITDAIPDNIVHNAHPIDLKGDSTRRKDQNANLTASENTETRSQAEDQPCPKCPGITETAVRDLA
jgi:hypothetical protein